MNSLLSVRSAVVKLLLRCDSTQSISFVPSLPALSSDWVQTRHTRGCLQPPVMPELLHVWSFRCVPASRCSSLWPIFSGDHALSVQTNCIRPEAPSVFPVFSTSVLYVLCAQSSLAGICAQCHPCVPGFSFMFGFQISRQRRTSSLPPLHFASALPSTAKKQTTLSSASLSK